MTLSDRAHTFNHIGAVFINIFLIVHVTKEKKQNKKNTNSSETNSSAAIHEIMIKLCYQALK